MQTASRSRRLLAATTFVVIGMQASIALALPIFEGPGGPLVPSGLRDPSAGLLQGSNNRGVFLAQATSFLNGQNTGEHGFRWDAHGGGITRFAGLGTTTQDSRVSAINSSGVVVGSATVINGDVRPVMYGPDSITPIPLAIPAFSSNNRSTAYAYLLNDSNVAAGQAEITQGIEPLGTRAVRWNSSGSAMTVLGALNTSNTGKTFSEASSMNANGTIVGMAAKWNTAGTTNLGYRGLRWASGSIVPFELDTPFVRNDGHANVYVRSVNLVGAAVGTVEKWSGANSQGDRAVRWETGGTEATVLGGLGGDVNGVSNANVQNINNSGVAIGSVKKYSATNVFLGYRAVRWDAGSTAAIELGLLPGESTSVINDSVAYFINNSGTVAGQAVGGGIYRAVIWPGANGGTTPLDLNSLLSAKDNRWALDRAYNVSDTGFVVGDARYDADGPGGALPYERAFSMLVPQAGTYGRGDANFDTAINFADLVILAQNYNTSNVTQKINVGDFNLDGFTNFADLVKLAQNYNTGVASIAALGNESLTADWALAQSSVPEPTAIAALTTLLPLIRRRRLSH